MNEFKIWTEAVEFTREAQVIMEIIDDDDEIGHWLFAQDYFVNNEGEPISDADISHYLRAAGATVEQVNKVLKIAHSEDKGEPDGSL